MIFCIVPSAGLMMVFLIFGVCLLGSRKNRTHHIVSAIPIIPVIGWIKNNSIVTALKRKTKILASLFIGTSTGFRMSLMEVFSIIFLL